MCINIRVLCCLISDPVNFNPQALILQILRRRNKASSLFKLKRETSLIRWDFLEYLLFHYKLQVEVHLGI